MAIYYTDISEFDKSAVVLHPKTVVCLACGFAELNLSKGDCNKLRSASLAAEPPE